jgi:toxin FitB
MRLLDSNIIIYATDPENEWLRVWLETEPFAISQVSLIEVLGYHQITPEEITDLQEFLYSSHVLPVSDKAASRAIALRQQRKMSLADSILAATALEHGCEFVSRNVDDFSWIIGLSLVNPFDFRP